MEITVQCATYRSNNVQSRMTGDGPDGEKKGKSRIEKLFLEALRKILAVAIVEQLLLIIKFKR